MASSPLYAGFDFGTTNSAAAIFDGEELRVVRNRAGAAFTPSVVHLDGGGRVSVGSRAVVRAQRDPAGAQREFKRLMGTEQRFQFPAAGLQKSPEDLAALILSALRDDVADLTGARPARAVISVPALFELPQNKATAEAARLAGFEQIELLQEPIASALAAGWKQDDSGAWLVYDLGGGTFDVSLLETRDGLLRVVGHDGDNFLGGRDFDHAIVDWIIAELSSRGAASPDRGNPDHAPVLAQLRSAAEAAKVELSRTEESEIYVDEPIAIDGRETELDLTLDRETMERLCAPLVTRSLDVCHRLLRDHGLEPDQLSRIVLVGGPSVMPLVRRQVAESLGAPLADGHDPMTLVAEGAALYAATAGLDGREYEPAAVRSGARRVWCQFPPVSADLEPHVIGRFESADGEIPTHVELIRVDGNDETWRSGPTPVDDERAFVLASQLEPHRPNQFRLRATDARGNEVPVHPDTVRIIHGVTLGDPPLSRTTGVALANNSVHVYFERGTALPARRTFTHYTIATVPRGSEDSVLSIPIVQGEFDQANLCQLVGSLEIPGSALRESVNSGTPVEVTVVIDRGGRLEATARIQSEDGSVQQFDQLAQLVMPRPTVASLEENARAAQKKVDDAIAVAFSDQEMQRVAELQSIQQRLAELQPLIDALSGGDADAGQRAARQLLDIDADLTRMEQEANWPTFEAEAQESYSLAVTWIAQYGNDSEQRLLDRAAVGLERALGRQSAAEATRHLRVIQRLGAAAFRRDPYSAQYELEYYVSRLEEATDLRAAKKLVKAGQKAERKGDHRQLQAVIAQLDELFPPDSKERVLSYNSGLR